MDFKYVTPSCTVISLDVQELICTSVDRFHEQETYEFS